jgi:hypothetical protein
VYARIRADGFMTVVGTRLAEVAGISAPMFHADGSIAALLTLTMPAHRFDERHGEEGVGGGAAVEWADGVRMVPFEQIPKLRLMLPLRIRSVKNSDLAPTI